MLPAQVFSTVFYATREAAQTGDTIPSHSTPLSNAVFDPRSPLYANLDEKVYPHSHLYVESLARCFDGWTGASLEKVSYKYWGFER